MATLQRAEGTFQSRDQLALHWQSWIPESPKAHIALVHGYAEHIGRYDHVAVWLAERGYAVHGFDCRGHGKSQGKRGHCERFEQFLEDFEDYLTRVKVSAGGKKVFTLGHSHGGLITARWLIDHPDAVSGAVFTSPFFRLAFEPPKLKVWGALMIGNVLPWLPVSNELSSEQLTRDTAMVAAHKVDKLVNPNATPRWFVESQRAQREVMELAPKMHVPFTIHAGGADPIAHTPQAEAFHARAGSQDKSFKAWPGALHEVMNETNRAEILGEIDGWLAAHL